MRRPQLWLWLTTALLAAAPGRPEILVKGRVALADGEPLAAAAVELLPVRSGYERGVDELAGRLVPEPVLAAATGDDGLFELRVPEAGFWGVRVSAEGYVPRMARLWPLVDDLVLPQLTVRPTDPMEVVVRGPEGDAVAGAVVTATGRSPTLWQERRRHRRNPWWPSPRLAFTDDQGRARLERAAGERLAVRAFAAGLAAAGPTESSDGRLELRLGESRQVAVTVQVTDQRGTPVADALIVFGGESRAVGLTGEDGALRTTLAADARVGAIDAAGAGGAARTDAEQQSLRIRLTPPRAITGQVVDAASREPVAGALVWARGRGENAARSDGGGRFSLRTTVRAGRTQVEAAAPGYFQDHARLAPEGQGEPVVALRPSAAVSGQVVDAQDRPVAGAELTTRIDPTSRSSFSVFPQHEARALSGEDGGFRLAGLTPDVGLRLIASKEGYAEASLALGSLAARRSRDGLRLVLESGVSLIGRVVGNGEPVAGAELTLVREPQGSSPFELMAGRLEEVSITAATDEEGAFEVTHLVAGGYRMSVRAAGFATLVMPGIRVGDDGDAGDLGTLELEPGVEIAGIVVDEAGRAVAGAEVAASDEDSELAFVFSFAGARGEPAATSGADGRFLIPDRRRGQLVDIQVTHPDYLEATAAAVEAPTDAPVRIVLERGSGVSGVVVDPTGGPVARARVAVEPDDSAGMAARFSAISHQALTDDTGAFEIDGVKPGKIRLTASATGWVPTELADLDLTRGESLTGLRIELQRGATVSGRVSTAAGAPALDVMVMVQESASPFRHSRSAVTSTGGDGRYVLEGVEPGLRTIAARSQTLGTTAKEIEVAPGVNRLDLRFIGGVEISGRVLDATGAPIAGAVVSALSSSQDWQGAETQSEADGAFTIEGVRDGRQILRAAKAGYATRTMDPPLQVAGSPISGLELVLERGGAVTGRVIGIEPAELSQVTVMAARGQSERAVGRVSHDGTYRVADLAPGEWQIWASLRMGRQVSGRATVAAAGDEVTLDLEFASGVVLTGQVLQSGRPLGGTILFVRGIDVPGGAGARTDHEGRFRVEGLKEGRHRLVVNDFRSGLQHSEEIELDGDRDVLVDIATGRVAGRVLDADDRSPLADAVISLVPEAKADSGSMAFWGAPAAESDGQGGFAVGSVSAGEYRLKVVREGYAPAELPLAIAGGEEVAGLEILLQVSSGLRLQVRRSTGAPVAELYYAILDDAGRALDAGRRVADENGVVRLTSVPAGSFDLLASAAGAAVRRLRVEVPGPPVVIDLQPSSSLTVTVGALAGEETVAELRLFGADGRPFLGLLWVQVQDRWQLPLGKGTIDSLPSGGYRVEVTAPDGRTWQGEASVVAGAVNRLDL